MSAKDRAAEDRQLAKRASQGDLKAFTKLVRAHSSLVYRVALRMLGGKEEYAKDVSQEVWIRVWKNIQTFRGESAFSTWLYRIAVTLGPSLGLEPGRFFGVRGFPSWALAT